MTQVYFVRHAHASWTSDEMRPLSEQGRVDAFKVADLLEPVAPAAIYSSPYLRARQTVEPLASRLGVSIQEMADLRERHLSSDTMPDFQLAVRRTWEEFGFAHPGGECNRDAQRRGTEACRQITASHKDGSVIVSTHGNLMTLILNAFDPRVGFDFWSRLSMPDIYVLQLGSQAIIRQVWTDITLAVSESTCDPPT